MSVHSNAVDEQIQSFIDQFDLGIEKRAVAVTC